MRLVGVGGRALWVHSPHDPEDEARRILLTLPPHDVLLVAGVGIGYVARAAAAEVIAFEASSDAAAAARPHLGGLRVHAAGDGLGAVADRLRALRGARVAATANRALVAADPEAFLALETAAAEALGRNPLGPALGLADLDALAARAAGGSGGPSPLEGAAWILDRIAATSTRRERGFS